MEIPDTDPNESPPDRWYLAVPQGLDGFDLYLPDLASRTYERRSARWPAADAHLKDRVKRAKKEPPAAKSREITAHLEVDGQIIGYSGFTESDHLRFAWVERHQQVWQDVRRGLPLLDQRESNLYDLTLTGHQGLEAKGADGLDRIPVLPIAREESHSWLTTFQTYPDLYLRMRLDE